MLESPLCSLRWQSFSSEGLFFCFHSFLHCLGVFWKNVFTHFSTKFLLFFFQNFLDLWTHLTHPRNLTWNLKMMVSKWTFLFQGLIFRFHIKFRGCSHFWHHFKVFQLRFQSAPREGELPLYDRGIELPQTWNKPKKNTRRNAAKSSSGFPWKLPSPN